MTAVRRGLFTILGAATAATTLALWTPTASAQAGHNAKKVKQKAGHNSASTTSSSSAQTGTQTSTAPATTSTDTGTQTSTSPTSSTDTATQTSTTPTTTSTDTGTPTSTASTTTSTDTTTQATSVPAPVQYFPPAAIWTQDVSSAPVDPQSSTIINSVAQAGGWGTGLMRVDFSIRVMQANASTPTVPFKPAQGFLSVDSDLVPSVPLPPGGGMEAQSGYQCDPSQQDCHFIVVDNDQGKLYEAYGANYDGSALSASVLAVWNLNLVYPASGRGDQCTSADAAGYPIAPLLFTADELARGHIDHAIRFILPNDRIRAGVFIHPATHAGGPQGSASTPPYGAHLRLKASYDLSQLKPAARVVAQAMQKYGMFLADGGNIALTAQSDQDTQTKYSDVDFNPTDLSSLKVTDFEVVQMGPTIPLTYNCVRNPL